jgi:hypothetical protein
MKKRTPQYLLLIAAAFFFGCSVLSAQSNEYRNPKERCEVATKDYLEAKASLLKLKASFLRDTVYHLTDLEARQFTAKALEVTNLELMCCLECNQTHDCEVDINDHLIH